MPRVMKLEPITRFSLDEKYDEYYEALYIYPEGSVDPTSYKKTYGEKGIVANYATRSLLTVGD